MFANCSEFAVPTHVHSVFVWKLRHFLNFYLKVSVSRRSDEQRYRETAIAVPETGQKRHFAHRRIAFEDGRHLKLRDDDAPVRSRNTITRMDLRHTSGHDGLRPFEMPGVEFFLRHPACIVRKHTRTRRGLS